MDGVNHIAISAAAIASFTISLLWHSLFYKTTKRLSSEAAAMMSPEFVRSRVLAIIIAILVALSGVAGWEVAMQLALCLWIGFPVVLLSGTVMQKNMPQRPFILRADDWFFKLHSIAVIVGLTR